MFIKVAKLFYFFFFFLIKIAHAARRRNGKPSGTKYFREKIVRKQNYLFFFGEKV
jgi:hypothetical protein